MIKIFRYESKPEIMHVIEFNGTKNQAEEIIQKYSCDHHTLALHKNNEYGYYISVESKFDLSHCFKGDLLVLSKDGIVFVEEAVRKNNLNDMYHNKSIVSDEDILTNNIDY